MLDWLACLLVRVVGGILCRLPPGAAVWAGERLGALASWLQPRRTQAGLINLRAAFDGALPPDEAGRIIRRCYRQLGAGLMELLRLPVLDRAYVDRYISVEGRRHFEQAMAGGRPVILLTGHYGNWELSSIAAALNGYPIVALARAQHKLPRLYRLLVSYRESKGCAIVHKGGAMKRLIAALEQRRLVGIVGDQASRQGVFVEFFGRPALFATGPFALAYSKDALIVPAFMHRVRGPFHRLVVEPPISLKRELPEAEAVRQGIDGFAAVLTRHILEDPAQWLWMHKRWKHTPARRALVLSDGKRGHLKQSLAVVEAMRGTHPQLAHTVVEIRYRHRLARAAAWLWSGWLPRGFGAARVLAWALAPDSARSLLGRYADVVASCGASTTPANLLWAAANRAKSVVLMNPRPLPLGRFDLVIAPRHDGLPKRSNVVQTLGALAARLSDDALLAARSRLLTHPRFRLDLGTPLERRQPVIAVFIGGDTAAYALTETLVDTLIEQVLAACEAADGWCLVTSSRRTPEPVERLLAERLGRHPRCRLLVLASRDPLDGTMEGMLGSADISVVTGESISMVSEACGSGQRVLVVAPVPRGSGLRGAIPRLPATQPWRVARDSALRGSTKHARFLRELAREGYARLVPASALAQAIQEGLAQRQAPRRLDNDALLRRAVRHLL